MSEAKQAFHRKTSRSVVGHFSSPTPKNNAPFGTVWKEKGDKVVYYMQIGREPNKPRWIRMGIFLEIALEKLFADEEFMTKCLGLFNAQKR